jgi:uncharacterized membrane protein
MSADLEILREWTGWFCHKLPERSPQCAGEIFPVCFRCAGLELGIAASYLSLFVTRRWRGRFPSVRIVAISVAMMLPLVIDGLGCALGLWFSPGWLRTLTGLGVGLNLPWLLSPLAQPLESSAKPSLENFRQMILPALIGVAAVLILDCWPDQIAFHILAFVASAGWCLFLGHFVLALVRSYGGGVRKRVLLLFSQQT